MYGSFFEKTRSYLLHFSLVSRFFEYFPKIPLIKSIFAQIPYFIFSSLRHLNRFCIASLLIYPVVRVIFRSLFSFAYCLSCYFGTGFGSSSLPPFLSKISSVYPTEAIILKTFADRPRFIDLFEYRWAFSPLR